MLEVLNLGNPKKNLQQQNITIRNTTKTFSPTRYYYINTNIRPVIGSNVSMKSSTAGCNCTRPGCIKSAIPALAATRKRNNKWRNMKK